MESDLPLAPYTTFRIGGPARLFAEAFRTADIRRYAAEAKQKSLPLFVFGGGSNLLVSDRGFPGLALRVSLRGFSYERGAGGDVRLIAAAGEPWDELVRGSAERGLWGLENLSYIPGLVGGAPVQNVGAYGAEAADVIEWVEAYDLATGALRRLGPSECRFGYRMSLFKRPPRRFVITRVAFLLNERPRPRLSYGELAAVFSGMDTTTLSPGVVRDAVIAIRRKKLPEIAEFGTAGSFFKNPVVAEGAHRALLRRFPDLPIRPVGDGRFKLPAAWLLDALGWRGRREEEAGVYDKHALVLINHGKASAASVRALAEKMRRNFFAATGVTLEDEVESISR